MDTKSANRIAFARDEGIYRRVRDITPPAVPMIECIVCGRRLTTSALTRASHGKKHVREGKAVARTEYSYDGPRTVYEPVR